MNSTSANFTVYNSSAGSGKTFTLVKEYLKIALKNNNSNAYKGILAVTFTNKAASEMKERVISALQALSGQKEMVGTPKHLLEALLKPINQGGLGITELEIKERSGLVLRSILHHYNDFAISTIDKFTTKIIRTFALDLKLPLNFGIELNEDEVLKNSVDMLIAEVGVNEKLTKLLIEYSKQKADDEKSWKIEIELIKFAKNILKDGGEAHLEKLRNLSIDDFEQIKKDLIVSINTFEKEVKELGTDTIDFINKQEIEHTSFSSSYIPKYFIYLVNFQDKNLLPTPSVQKMFAGEQEWYSKKTPQPQKDLIDANKNEITAFYNEIQTLLQNKYGDYILKTALLKNIYQIAVINEIEKTIQEFKTDNNILNLSDFNKQIAKIILTESIPFIYERLGEKYHHYLIDEFQDTSTIQWQNLLPLIENSLGNGNYNMVVGDAKQAIYRFRGGEVEQIINLPNLYNHQNNILLVEREQALIRNYKAENLNDNYRSKAEIVDFNNQFFNFISRHLSEKFKHIYESLDQGFDVNNTGGGVSISFLDNEDENINFTEILSIIKTCLNDGYQYSDIAILTKRNDDASEVASYLLENNIQVISTESLLLNNSNEVKFLISLFNYFANPKDATHHLYSINYLINSRFIDEENINYFQHKNQDFLADYLKLHQLSLYVPSTYSLYELTEHLIQHFSLSKEINIFIQFFIDKVYEYASKHDNSIVNFLEWWKTKSSKFSVIIPAGINAVQVMTIHKSKGLEFPIVIFPFAKTKGKDRNEDYLWTDKSIIEGLPSAILNLNQSLLNTVLKDEYENEIAKSILDTINVLYVVLTRPKDRMYILSDKPKPNKDGKTNNYFYDYCLSKPDAAINETEYRFGLFAAQKLNEIHHESSESEVMSNSSYNSWRNKINISYQAPKFWNVDNPETYTDYGNLIHQLLSEIKHIEDLETTLDKFIHKGLVDQNHPNNYRDEILNELQELLKIPKVASFFTDFDELKTETSILLPTGESYQPDRVIIRNNKAIIIDYKTGKKEKLHHEQLENYKFLLSQMGYTNIESYLLYIKDKELVEV